jgi:hypothetical protein
VRWEQPVERACYRLQRAAQYRFPGLLDDKRRPFHQSWVRRHHSLQNGLLLSSYFRQLIVGKIGESVQTQ